MIRKRRRWSLNCWAPTRRLVQIGEIIAGRAAGNPFFAEEIIRELAERGVLVGERGGYTCAADVADVGVPATLQATIAARIDRLEPGGQTHACRRRGDRVSLQARPADKPGNRTEASTS